MLRTDADELRLARVDLGSDAHRGASPAADPSFSERPVVERPVVEWTRASDLPAPWSRVAGFGGSALAVALVGAELERDPSARPLVLAVGDAVRRGLPTAARAVVGGLAPLTGGYGEGQVGGALGPRLAACLDGLLVTGRVDRERQPGAVLVIAADGASARIVALGTDLAERSPAERIAAVAAACGRGATLASGPAGDRGVALASLAAAEQGSGHPPSFVGRGGLGAVLGGLGLAAIHVTAEPAEAASDPDLDALLRASPRLVERASGGGFEQALGDAVRGERGLDGARADVDGWKARRDARVGCRGCPTPCGFVFESPVFERPPLAGAGGGDGAGDGTRTSSAVEVRGHFGAAKSLGPRLGLDDREAALGLLARCDGLGLDAKEVGAVLERLIGAGHATRDPRALGAWIERIGGRRPDASEREPSGDLVAAARRGASALDAHLGPRAARADRGDAPAAALAQPGLPRRDLAALALAVGAGAGTDPMRSFPFATQVGRARLAHLVAPSTGPLPAGSERPERAAGKGLVAWWHESFVAGVDANGFCVFSAAGLLADGVCDLDGLARRLGLGDGTDLLARGAATVLARAEIARRLGRPIAPPTWARDLVPETVRADYRAARGVDGAGHPTAPARAALGTRRLGAPLARLDDPVGSDDRRGARAGGRDGSGSQPGSRVTVRALGLIDAAGLGPLELDLPAGATLVDLLERAARARPAWRRALGTGPAPSAWCQGRRLEPDDPVPPGASVDLLRALAGG